LNKLYVTFKFKSFQIQVTSSRLVKLIPLLTLAAFTFGCPHVNSGLPPPLRSPLLETNTPAEGLYHTVARNDDLNAIAKAYNVDPQQLAEVNNLKPPYLVTENTKLFIPGVSTTQKTDVSRMPATLPTRIEDFSGLLAWPVEGKIISEFGVRGGVQYNGISIEAADGTPVRCADDGRVGHVGSIPGYGNVVLVEHANRVVTVYAHLKEIKTSTGLTVKKGSVIGTVGSSGRVETPCLYFEVRSRSKPRNPLFFLVRRM